MVVFFVGAPQETQLRVYYVGKAEQFVYGLFHKKLLTKTNSPLFIHSNKKTLPKDSVFCWRAARDSNSWPLVP